jgi:hypothetical protein
MPGVAGRVLRSSRVRIDYYASMSIPVPEEIGTKTPVWGLAALTNTALDFIRQRRFFDQRQPLKVLFHCG